LGGTAGAKGAAGRGGNGLATGAGRLEEAGPTLVDGMPADFGGACVVMLGTTVVEEDAGAFTVLGGFPAVGGAGTSTITEHLGQRAFLPAYLASTLNLAAQAGHRHKTSDMVESLREATSRA
jgi:hypothetical protein